MAKKSSSNLLKLRRKYCAISIVVALGFCSTASLAAVQPTPQQISEYTASPEPSRVKLLIILAKGGNHELAASLLKSYPLQGEHAANRTLYIKGLILKSEGNLTGAVKNFRAALADQPKLTLVRQELATTLLALDENDSAKHHLKMLEADAPDETAAADVRSFIEQIDEKTPYRFGAYLSFAPSTNVNNGSNHATVYSPIFGGYGKISDSRRAQSGLGVASGVNAGYSRRLGNDFMTVLAGGIEARLYDQSDFNSFSSSQSAEIRYLLSKGYIGAGIVASENLDTITHDLSTFNYGPRLSLSYSVTPQDRFSASVLHEWRTRPNSDSGDETAWIIDVGLNHAIDSSATIGITAGFDSIQNDYGSTSYDTWSIGLNGYQELPKGITFSTSSQIRFSEFDDEMILAGKTRDDTRFISSTTLTKRDLNIFGYAPSLEYTYTNNMSNISLFDYDGHAIDFRLTKDF